MGIFLKEYFSKINSRFLRIYVLKERKQIFNDISKKHNTHFLR